eukprot:jgi/Pico_ML_1/54191/g4602.t1
MSEAQVQEAVDFLADHQTIFIPELHTNASENWFSQFKHYMRNSTTKDFDGVHDDYKRCIRKFTPEHYHNYFQYAYRKHEYPH